MSGQQGWGPQGPGNWPAPPPPQGAPGWGGAPGPYGRPPAYGAPGGRVEVRHKPGVGLWVALVGVAMFLVSFMGPAWVEAGDQELNFSDLRDMVEPEGFAEASDLEFFAIYAEWMWIVVLLVLTVAVVFSTLYVPSSKAARVVIGFLTGGMLGLIVHVVDDEGTFAPRVTGALSTIGVAAVHALAVLQLLANDSEPDPGIGIWLGFAGLLVVLFGCVLGTRTERFPASSYGHGYGAPQYR
jgi:hypothetical protein